MNQNMKQQMMDQMNKIQELFQNSCKRILSLINSDSVNVIQTNQIMKCLNRIQKFLEINQSPIQPQNKKIIIKQEPFNQNDYEIIQNYAKNIIKREINFKDVCGIYFNKVKNIVDQIEVDEKTVSFDDDGYYGYKMNGIPNGVGIVYNNLGIQIKQDRIVIGCFMGGEINPDVPILSLKSIQISENYKIPYINVESELSERIQKFFEIYPNLIKYKTFENNTEIIENLRQATPDTIFQVLDYYIGQAKKISENLTHKHGYGIYIDLLLPTLAWGVWRDNKFADGLLISKDNGQFFKHEGQMGDHHQGFIQY